MGGRVPNFVPGLTDTADVCEGHQGLTKEGVQELEMGRDETLA